MSNYQRWKGCMKAYPFEEKRLAKWRPPYIVQPKYDGFRCRAYPLQTGLQKNEYLLLTSEENVFFSAPHISDILRDTGLRCELDGELYSHDMYKEGGFNLISSVLSRTVNVHSRALEIRYHIFDIVNDQPQMKRLLMLENLKDLSPWLVISPFWLCETLKEVLETYDKIIDLGYEGIIVRNMLTPYVRKRSTLMMKFKAKAHDFYPIVGTQEEYSKDGVPKGTLGSLVCASGDGELFSVGTGFTEEQRKLLWNKRDRLVGKVAKVKYQHLTSGKKVPRHSVFVEIL